jgi:hypothetical protein
MAYDSPSSGSNWIRSNWLDLENYRFQWVASTGNGLAVHASTLGEVLQQVDGDIDATTDWAFSYVDGQEFEPDSLNRELRS